VNIVFHNSKEMNANASKSPAIGVSSAIAAIDAFGSLCLEHAVLSKRLFDNTQKLWLSAATHKDAKDASRTMAAFVNASYRDISQNADAVLGIWRRFVRDALPPPDSA
jgi:hypothetical protein